MNGTANVSTRPQVSADTESMNWPLTSQTRFKTNPMSGLMLCGWVVLGADTFSYHFTLYPNDDKQILSGQTTSYLTVNHHLKSLKQLFHFKKQDVELTPSCILNMAEAFISGAQCREVVNIIYVMCENSIRSIRF